MTMPKEPGGTKMTAWPAWQRHIWATGKIGPMVSDPVPQTVNNAQGSQFGFCVFAPHPPHPPYRCAGERVSVIGFFISWSPDRRTCACSLSDLKSSDEHMGMVPNGESSRRGSRQCLTTGSTGAGMTTPLVWSAFLTELLYGIPDHQRE